ncbi:MAG TPA: hypothetical protein VGH27_24910 [Streptosporangiaceae bacterium]|jgi:hypothetical protein
MNSYMMQGMAAGRGKDLRKQAVVARRAKQARRVRRAGHPAGI